jgi:hypothetical protein
MVGLALYMGAAAAYMAKQARRRGGGGLRLSGSGLARACCLLCITGE